MAELYSLKTKSSECVYFNTLEFLLACCLGLTFAVPDKAI